MRVGPDVEKLLDLDREPDAHGRGGGVAEVGKCLKEDVELQHDRVVDVQTQKDGADREKESPCC